MSKVPESLEPEDSKEKDSKESSSQTKESLVSGLEGFLVITLFLVFYNTLDLKWGIAMATAGSLFVVISRFRRGAAIGKFLPIVTVLIVVRGVLGIVTDSENFYFGFGIAQRVAFVIVLLVSVLIGKNLVATAASYLFDFKPEIKVHPVYKHTLNRLAYVACIYYLIIAAFDTWLLANSSVNGYVLLKTAVSWPLGLAAFWGSVGYASKKFSQIPGWEGFMVMMERQAHSYAAIFKQIRGKTSPG